MHVQTSSTHASSTQEGGGKGMGQGANVNAKTAGEGWTAAHIAASRGHTEMLALLIGRGSDLSLRNMRGETPLDTAWRSQGSSPEGKNLRSTVG